MIEGRVNEARDAVIPLTIYRMNGHVVVNAVVDTGFNDALTLPFPILAPLGLQADLPQYTKQSDGNVIQVMCFIADVEWHGTRKQVTVQMSGGDILVGMGLMEGSRLTIDVEMDGMVTIAPRP